MGDTNDPKYCHCCGALLKPGRMVWLELDNWTNLFYDPKVTSVHPERSQGGFPFGTTCAKVELEYTKVALVAEREGQARDWYLDVETYHPVPWEE